MAASVQSKYLLRPVVPQDRSPECRLIIDNIPPNVTEQMLRQRLANRGDARIHVFVPACEYTKGWAWVSFENSETRKEIVDLASNASQARRLDAAKTTDKKGPTPSENDDSSTDTANSGHSDIAPSPLEASSGGASRDEEQPLVPRDDVSDELLSSVLPREPLAVEKH